MEMANTIGQVIKKRREYKGLKLRHLSKMSGVSSSGLGRIERGERFPSAHTLRVIAQPLGFGENELFELAGIITPSADGDRIGRMKDRMKAEVVETMAALYKRIDNL